MKMTAYFRLHMEVGHCDGAGTRMGSDGGADCGDGKMVRFAFPEGRTVLDVLL